MIIKNNDAGLFIRKWQEEVQKMMRNGIKKIPESPGAGWLSNTAAKHNLCSAVWREDGDWAVCAAPLKKYPSGDPYLCKGHAKKQQDYVDSLKEKEEMSEDDDLPF